MNLTASVNGRSGGVSRTPDKVRAARENGQKGGRPKSFPRCPCGAMTLKRARARHHHC